MNAWEATLEAIAREARDRSEDIEAARALPEDLGLTMARGGLFRTLVPQCYGGLEAHPATFVHMLETLGHADGATGWCAMIGSTTGLLSASLPEHWARRIYADHPDVISSGVTAPMGRALDRGDHWQVSGRWPFGSAARNSSWICAGCLVVDADGEPVAGPKGLPEVRLMFFPRADVKIHDNWQVSGLQGTGSSDIEVDGVAVPKDRVVLLGGRARIDAPLYRFPTLGLLAVGVASVTLGIARRALDELVDLAGGKVPTGGRQRLAQKATIQAEVGRADAALKGAQAYLHAAIDAAWQRADSGQRLDLTHKTELRAAAVHATWAAVDAVDRAYHAGGGSAIYTRSPLQRCFRDVHVATQHAMVAQPIYELTGRVRLGLEPGGLL